MNDARSTDAELAEIGVELGDDGDLWRAALRAFASIGTLGHEPGSPRAVEMVAGQVYARRDRGSPDQAKRFVEIFRDLYGLEELDDVDDLLAREAFQRRNYEGQLAFARER